MTRQKNDNAPRLTSTGRLSESYGDAGCTVRLWERYPGENVMLQWGKPAAYDSLGYPVRVRNKKGKWEWNFEALERGRSAAKDKSARIRLGVIRESVQPEATTVRQAFALFTDEEDGGLPESASGRRNYRIAAREFNAKFGDLVWNTVTPAEWESVIWRAKGEGLHGKAAMLAKNLRAVHRWLVKKRRMKALLDPLEDFEWKALTKGVTPKQERYSEAEMRKILEVRDLVDPRFALMLVMAAEAGPRGKAIRLWRRSQLDAPVLPAPPSDMAPHGWTYLPPLKGQDAPLVFLTAFARREIEKALTGYLRHLEARYQESRVDYPMLPGARIGDAKVKEIHISQVGAYRPAGTSAAKKWMARAESLAGVKHVDWRLWHGMRRLWTDRVEDAAGLDVAAVAGSWADRTMVERIYRNKLQFSKLGRAREVLEPSAAKEPE